MKYFTISELLHSDTAKAQGIDNTPSTLAVENMNALIDSLLDPIREAWGAPLKVNSGYRSPALNSAVGGADSSDHKKGRAADLTTGSVSGNKRLYNFIVEMQRRGEITYDQVIQYPSKGYSLVHVSWRGKLENRKEALAK